MDVLLRIKRLAFARKIALTYKAADEMERDGLTEDDVIESLVTATHIAKTIRSQSSNRSTSREKLYIIKSASFGNVVIYTKGTIRRAEEGDVFYILISSKRAL